MGLWEDRILPWMIDRACRHDDIDGRRERIVPRALGRVVELGVGSGLNLRSYDAAAVTGVVGVDPSRGLLERARDRAAGCAVPLLLVEGDAEALPVPDGWADTVVVTFTLCTIPDPGRALAEARRVLAPGGRLWFAEHGLAPEEGVRRWQRRLTPVWRRVSGGCHLDRPIPDLVRAAGFEIDEIDADWMEAPKIAGWTWTGRASVPGEPGERSGGSPAAEAG